MGKIKLNRFLEALERKNSCRWCSKSAIGEYSMAEFTNPDMPGIKATMAFYEGNARVDIDADGDLDGATLVMPIKYCPMCGRRITEKEKRNDDSE